LILSNARKPVVYLVTPYLDAVAAHGSAFAEKKKRKWPVLESNFPVCRGTVQPTFAGALRHRARGPHLWQAVIDFKVMVGGEMLEGIWKWIKTHKAATALIVVLLTLVPVLPEYKIVDAEGRDEKEIKKFLCSKLPDDYNYRTACSLAVESEIRLTMTISFSDKRPLVPGLFQKRRKAYVFDYYLWRQNYERTLAFMERWNRENEKLFPKLEKTHPKVER
jgi:hypothetical protein